MEGRGSAGEGEWRGAGMKMSHCSYKKGCDAKLYG